MVRQSDALQAHEVIEYFARGFTRIGGKIGNKQGEMDRQMRWRALVYKKEEALRRPLYMVVAGLLLASFLASCAPATAPTPVPPQPTAVAQPTAAPAPTVAPATGTTPVEWELVVPQGVREIKPIELAPRITTLEGKTIVLRWNGKHNGDNFLNRIAELLAEKVPTAKVIKLWEKLPESAAIVNTADGLAKVTKATQDLKPDIVIASQAD